MAKKHSGKKQQSIPSEAKDDVEIELEKAVFGDIDGFEKGLEAVVGLDELSSSGGEEEQDNTIGHEEIPDDDLFVIDQDIPGLDEDENGSIISSSPEEEESAAAWIDSDDEGLAVSLSSVKRLRKLRQDVDEDVISGKEYTRRLRSHFTQIYPVPKWANAEEMSEDSDMMDMDGDDDDDQDRVQHHGDALKKVLESTSMYTTSTKGSSGGPLPPTSIDILRLKDANIKQPAHSGIQTISFHPNLPLLLMGGFDRTLRVFHIDGKENNLVSSLHLKNLPIQTSEFLLKNRILISGRRKFMYLWDLDNGIIDKVSRLYGHEEHQKSMEKFKSSNNGNYIAMCGSSGWINILSGNNCQWVCGCKIEGNIADLDWINNRLLIIANTDSDLWLFDVQGQIIIARWYDNSRISTTTISCIKNNNNNNEKNQHVSEITCAVGTQSGIVYMYNLITTNGGGEEEEEEISPICTFDQLVTPISSLLFSPNGEILAIASRSKRDSLRIIHTGTKSIFKNWPTSNTPLGRVTAISFSPSTNLIAIGNDAGKTRLYRFNHYV